MENLTEEQRRAVKHKGGFCVVSAAAGSGKTTVIVKRVINLIMHKGVEADKFLIVTFTRAAAIEMKNRIAKLLTEKIEADPFNKGLRRQKSLFEESFIGTIDGFCAQIVRENFEKCGVLPNFRVADENELIVIKNEVINVILEKLYEKDVEKLVETVDFFSDGKNDLKFIDNLYKAYNYICACADPVNLAKECERSYVFNDFAETKCGRVINSYLDENLKYVKECLEIAAEISNFDEKMRKFSTALKNEAENLSIEELKNFKFPMCSVRGAAEETKKIFAFVRERTKKAAEKTVKFIFDKKNFKKDAKKIYRILNNFFRILEIFTEEFHRKKTEKNILDFADLERLALGILRGEGTSTEISERFEEIMIDEYQDTNRLQDEIFSHASIKGKGNLFIVGDVKQSIYGFRLAKPEIFLEHRKSAYHAITLGHNFRSSESIVKTVNCVFGVLMSEAVCGINYNEGHELICGLKTEGTCAETELKIIDSSVSDEADEFLEARYIANLIFKMKDRKPCDICILLRNTKNKSAVFLDALLNRGINAVSFEPADFFEAQEIKMIIPILKIIGNPMRDISFVAVLMCPVFGFTADEIAEIRLESRETYFFYSLKKKSEQSGDLAKKCRFFLEKINFYRDFSFNNPLDLLIGFISDDLAFPYVFSVASRDTKKITTNLRRFSEMARRFCEENGSDLSGFLDYIEKLENSEESLQINRSEMDENAVKIMSIHASKGLEFPVCIVAGCSGKFRRDYDEILMHGGFGASFRLKNADGTARFPNVFRGAFEIEAACDKTAEELRLLYVAMTRARKKLIFVASSNDPEKEIEESECENVLCGMFENERKAMNFFVRNSESFADWLFFVNAREKCFKTEIINPNFGKVVNTKSKTGKDIIEIDEKILEKLEFKYLFSKENVPVKIAASRFAEHGKWQEFIAYSEPNFMNEFVVSPEFFGTAVHEFLRYCDFDVAYRNYFGQVDVLFKRGFFSEKQRRVLLSSEAVRLIGNFLCGELGTRVRASSEVFREYKFSLRHGRTVIQGAIDCIFAELDGFVLVDYKSDRIAELEVLAEKYHGQLMIYKKAFEKCEEKNIKELIIYSMRKNLLVKLDKNYMENENVL